MIRFGFSMPKRPLRREFGRLKRMAPKVLAQELNRQNRTFKGATGKAVALPVRGLTQRLASVTGVAQKRIRRRIRQPRGAWATPQRLRAGGLTLYDTMPARWFKAENPAGGALRESKADKLGRTGVGPTFRVKLKSGARGTMRRLEPRVWGGGGRSADPHGLPIGWAHYVDMSRTVASIRLDVLRDLARAWPNQIDHRLRREFRRRYA